MKRAESTPGETWTARMDRFLRLFRRATRRTPEGAEGDPLSDPSPAEKEPYLAVAARAAAGLDVVAATEGLQLNL